MFIKKQAGFSIIQVMVAMGLAAVLSVAMMKQQETAGKMQQKMVANQDLNGITNQIQTMLANRSNCTFNLEGEMAGTLANPKGSTINPNRLAYGFYDGTNFVLKPNAPIPFEGGFPIGSTGYIIKDMHLYRDSDGQDQLSVNFRIGKRTPSGEFVYKVGGIGTPDTSKSFRIMGEKNPDNTFKECYSEAGEILEGLMKELPKCMITESACTTKYPKQGTVSLEVVTQTRRSCMGSYTKNACGFGTIPSPRKCYCTESSICTCVTKNYSCFQRHMAPCETDNLKTVVNYNKCCQGTGMTCPTGQIWNAGSETCVTDPNSCAAQNKVYNGSICVEQEVCTGTWVPNGLGGCMDPDPNGCGSGRTWTQCSPGGPNAGNSMCVDDGLSC